jgi:hypothetical protein
VLFLLLPQPIYQGPSRVEDLTPASFKEKVLDQPDSGIEWLVSASE